MQFNSLLFLISFTITAILYWILPHRVRVPLLLVASYVFYSVAGPKLLVYLVACTLATYILGRLIQKNIEKGKTRFEFDDSNYLKYHYLEGQYKKSQEGQK